MPFGTLCKPCESEWKTMARIKGGKRRLASSVLGIDISPQEIRIVEMRPNGMSGQIVKLGFAPTPPGAVDGDRILSPDALADAVRSLISRTGASSRSVVFGIGPQSIVTRVLDIPMVPDNELRAVIDGELAHYQILREGTGAFDYFRLGDKQGEEGNPQVLLMAAEQSVVDGYRDLAERCGLQLVALEPMLLAMYRAAQPHSESQGSVIALQISNTRSEIAITDHGEIRLYRRVDVGSDELITGRSSRTAAGPAEVRPLWRDEEEVKEEEAPGTINAMASRILVTELQRSLDYYRREFPNAPPVTKLILATNDSALGMFGSWISEALGIDALIAGSPGNHVDRGVIGHLVPPQGLRYLAAASLGMRAVAILPASVPQLSLIIRQTADPERVNIRRGLAICFGATAAVSAVAGFITVMFMRNANGLQLILDSRKQDLGIREARYQQRAADLEEQDKQLAALWPMGYPLPRIVDSLTSAIDPDSGLTDLSVDKAGQVAIGAEASDERSMIRSLEGLKRCAFFVSTSQDSYEWINSARERKVLKFSISAQLATAGPPAPGAPGASGASPVAGAH